jgi:hypothetical protein
MNLFLFLNKYGSKFFYFDFIIKINSNKYMFKIYKNGIITHAEVDTISNLKINNFQTITFKYLNVNLSISVPIEINKKIKNQNISIFVPKNKNNISTYNRLVKRKNFLKDTRTKVNSIFDIYNSTI